MKGSQEVLRQYEHDEFGPVIRFGDGYELRFEPLISFDDQPPRAHVALYQHQELVAEKVPVFLSVRGGDDPDDTCNAG